MTPPADGYARPEADALADAELALDEDDECWTSADENRAIGYALLALATMAALMLTAVVIGR